MRSGAFPGGAQLETDEWQLDAPDELASLGKTRITTLRLRGRDSYTVYVNIWPHGAYVGRFGDNADTIVVQGKLRDILLACRKRPYWLFSWWRSSAFWYSLFAGGLVCSFVVGGSTGRTAGVLLSGAAFVGVLHLIWHRSIRGSVVYLRHRRDSPSFLRRNSDTSITTGIVSVLAAVVGALLTYYLTRA